MSDGQTVPSTETKDDYQLATPDEFRWHFEHFLKAFGFFNSTRITTQDEWNRSDRCGYGKDYDDYLLHIDDLDDSMEFFDESFMADFTFRGRWEHEKVGHTWHFRPIDI